MFQAIRLEVISANSSRNVELLFIYLQVGQCYLGYHAKAESNNCLLLALMKIRAYGSKALQ